MAWCIYQLQDVSPFQLSKTITEFYENFLERYVIGSQNNRVIFNFMYLIITKCGDTNKDKNRI
jgi:hypothetical protein